MYVCGSTVYQRVHVGNSRPFVLGMWLRSWLRETGYEVTLVHNITDVDDKIYDEATRLGIASRELSARATEWFFEDTNDLGLGRPDVEPRATETIPEIVAFIGELVERGRAYEAGGDVYFSVAAAPEYGRLSGARLEDMVSQESSALKRDQRDFALWKSQKPHEDAAWDSPWGPGRPGWHIECSAMVREAPRTGVRDPRRRPRPAVPAPRERARAVERARAPLRARLDAQRHARARRREDVEVARQRRHAPQRARHVGSRGAPRLPPDGALEQAASTSRTRPWSLLAPAPRAFARSFETRASRRRRMPGSGSQLRSTTTSTRRRRSPSCTSGATTSCCDARSASSGSSRSQRTTKRRPRSSRSPSSGVEARAARDFDESDRLRAEIEAAGWDVRDEADGFRLVRRR